MASTASTTARVALLVFWFLCGSAHALSNGAPVCTEGASAPGTPHRGGDFQELSIAEGNMTVTINGKAIGAIGSLMTGISYEVTIARTGGTFRGVLARVNGGDSDLDTTSVMSLAAGDKDLNISQPCLAEGKHQSNPFFLLRAQGWWSDSYQSV
eukprot:scaffold14974_cov195-Amphora_coffeaeformis.AAC.34